MKFEVDKEACICCGACQAICEDVFEIVDAGYAVAKNIEVTDKKIKEDAISAMEGCPTSAIHEKKEDAKNIDSKKEEKTEEKK